MSGIAFHTQIAEKDSDKNELALRVVQNPHLLPIVFDGLESKTARIKYGCDKVLRILSETQPELVYPSMDFFLQNLDHEDSFLRWGAIAIVANLAAVDIENKFEPYFEKYFALIPGPTLAGAANTIKASVAIVAAKTDLADRIAQEILKVENATYKTAHCRDMAIGYAVVAFGEFYHLLQNKGVVEAFAKRALKNKRAATHKKAEKFITKLHNKKRVRGHYQGERPNTS